MSKEIRIGLLAIVAIALLIWGYKFLLGTNILERSQTFYVQYEDVDNLQVSDPVFIHGFRVGAVKDVYVNPEDFNSLIVELDVDRTIKLPRSTVAELKNEGVMGGKMINLEYQGNCEGDCIGSGEYITGKTLGFIQSMVEPSEINMYMKNLGEGMGDVIDSIGNSIDDNPDGALAQTIADLRIAVANLRSTTVQMNQLFSASSKQLVGVLDNINAVTNTLKDNNDQISEMITNANAITHQLASARLDTTILKTNRALGSTNDMIQSLDQTIAKADKTFTELRTLLAQMNSGKGTLGRLMKDDELYIELKTTTEHLGLLLQDLRVHPKRYFNLRRKNQEYVPIDVDPALEDTVRN